MCGNASDNVVALEMVERSEKGTGSVVEETQGDAVYGDGVTRQVFADAGRPQVAKLPRRPELQLKKLECRKVECNKLQHFILGDNVIEVIGYGRQDLVCVDPPIHVGIILIKQA